MQSVLRTAARRAASLLGMAKRVAPVSSYVLLDRCGRSHVYLRCRKHTKCSTCRNFANAELIPQAAKHDRKHLFPKEQIRKMGELGLMSITVPEEF